MEKRHPNPEDFVGYSIVRVAHVLQRRMDEALSSAGLNARQFSILVYLAQTPNITAGKLARLVLVTPQSMSDLLAGLVEAGLVEREPPSGRGHPMGAALTRAGRAALARAFPLVEELDRSTTAGMSRADAKRFNEQLHDMLERLGS